MQEFHTRSEPDTVEATDGPVSAERAGKNGLKLTPRAARVINALGPEDDAPKRKRAKEPRPESAEGAAKPTGEPPIDENSADIRALREFLRDNCAYIERGATPLYAIRESRESITTVNGEDVAREQITWKMFPRKTLEERYAADRLSDRSKATVFDEWREWKGRKAYRDARHVFKGEMSRHTLNLFCGFAVKPARGDWSLLKRHILDNVCSGSSEVFEWLMDWLADMFQNPHIKRPSAVIMVGVPGCGKSKVGEWVRVIIGAENSIALEKPDQIVGRFNQHFDGKLFVFAEEACFEDEPRAPGILKNLVSSGDLAIEGKGRDLVTVKSSLRLMVASNKPNPLEIEHNDRRYLVLKVSDAKARNTAYFEAIDTQMRNGGAEAMLADLIAREIRSNLAYPPNTDEQAAQKLLSLPPLYQEMIKIIGAGGIFFEGASAVLPEPGASPSRAHVKWFNDALSAQVRPVPTERELGDLKRAFGIKRWRAEAQPHPTEPGKSWRPRFNLLPSAQDMRASLAAHLKIDPKLLNRDDEEAMS